MYIYNVTTKIETRIRDAWVDWMKTTHIPEIMGTGCFTDYQFVQLLEVDDSDGPTFAVQYKATSRADYNRYIEIYAENLRKAAYQKWGNSTVGFRSLMQVVH